MNTQNPLPFRTTEPILALCLRMAGVPMWVPPMNVYDEPILKRLGYSGLKLRDAAKAADEAKQRGRVEYYFERTPELDFLITAFQDQEKEIDAKGNDRDAGERIREIMALATRPPEDRPDIPGPLMDEREALVRVFCIGFKFRPLFINQFKEWTSFLDITNGEKKMKDLGPDEYGRNQMLVQPGLKRVPVNADDNMLKKLKLL